MAIIFGKNIHDSRAAEDKQEDKFHEEIAEPLKYSETIGSEQWKEDVYAAADAYVAFHNRHWCFQKTLKEFSFMPLLGMTDEMVANFELQPESDKQ